MSNSVVNPEVQSIVTSEATPEDGLGAMVPFATARPERLALLGGAPSADASAFTICPWTTVSLA